MDIHIINKINSRLRFLYQPNKFLNISLRRLMWNSMIQPFPNYACNASYPKANKKLKIHLQAAQNTYFPKIGYWFMKEYSLWTLYIFFTKNGSDNFDETSYEKLDISRQKNNVGQKILSYVVLSLYLTLKTLTSLNAFKHKESFKSLDNSLCIFDVSR